MGKLVDIDLLQYYNEKIKEYIGVEDAKSIKYAYFDETTYSLKLFKTIPDNEATTQADFTIPLGGEIEIDTAEDPGAFLKKYEIKQNGELIGTIDIPKDLVVTGGKLVTDPEGKEKGKYIKLTIANQEEPVYINVADLIPTPYTAKQNADKIQLSISDDNKVSADIVEGSIETNDIKDGAITKEKIDSELLESLKSCVDLEFATTADIDAFFPVEE